MDNKKWYKRISTCFWFLLATLPWWISALTCLFSYFTNLGSDLITFDNITSFFTSRNYFSIFNGYVTQLNDYTISFLTTSFINLFNQVGISSSYIARACAWFVSVYFIELMVDFVVWLPRLCHSFIERWCSD